MVPEMCIRDRYMSFSAAPDDLEIIPASAFKEYEDGNKIYCETEDIFADWDVLLDNNKNTFLQTSTQPSMRTYEMYMELEERTAISGIKVTQFVIPRNDRSAPYFLPDMVVAQTDVYKRQVQYYASVNYTRDEGMLKTDRLNQFKVNIENNSFSFRTNLNIDLSLSLIHIL